LTLLEETCAKLNKTVALWKISIFYKNNDYYTSS
jgi:hypothetical protein